MRTATWTRVHAWIMALLGIYLVIVASLNIRIRSLRHPQSLRPGDVLCISIPQVRLVHRIGESAQRVVNNSDMDNANTINDAHNNMNDLNRLMMLEYETSLRATVLMWSCLIVGILMIVSSAGILLKI